MTKLEYLKESPSQTAGPYVHIAARQTSSATPGSSLKILGSAW